MAMSNDPIEILKISKDSGVFWTFQWQIKQKRSEVFLLTLHGVQIVWKLIGRLVLWIWGLYEGPKLWGSCKFSSWHKENMKTNKTTGKGFPQTSQNGNSHSQGIISSWYTWDRLTVAGRREKPGNSKELWKMKHENAFQNHLAIFSGSLLDSRKRKKNCSKLCSPQRNQI